EFRRVLFRSQRPYARNLYGGTAPSRVMSRNQAYRRYRSNSSRGTPPSRLQTYLHPNDQSSSPYRRDRGREEAHGRPVNFGARSERLRKGSTGSWAWADRGT